MVLSQRDLDKLRKFLKESGNSLPAASRKLGYPVTEVAAALVDQFGSTRKAALEVDTCYANIWKFLPRGYAFPNPRGGRPLGSCAPRRSPKALKRGRV